MKKIIIIMFLLTISFTTLYSYTDQDSSLFKITNSYITGTPKINDTITFTFEYESLVSDSINFIVNFSNSVQPLDSIGSETYKVLKIFADTGIVNQLNYSMKIADTGKSVINFALVYPKHGIKIIEEVAASARIEPGLLNGYAGFQPCNLDLKMNTYQEEYLQFTGANHNFSISGNVTYLDYFELLEGIDNYRRKGAFNLVRLWFHKPTIDDWTKLYLAKSLFENPPGTYNYIEGVHYAICDDEGNFSFNLEDVPLPMIGPVELWITVAKENEAITLISPPQPYEQVALLVNQQSTNIYYSETCKYNEEVDLNVLNHTIDNVNLDLPTDDGSVFRWSTMGYKLLLDKYNVSNPADLPFGNYWRRVEIQMLCPNFSSSWSGKYTCFENPEHIQLKDYRPIVVSHEYGHFIDDILNNDNGVNSSITEPWADFFSGAVLSYANNLFGDIPPFINNCELAPYFYFTLYKKEKDEFGNPVLIKVIDNLRFGNLTKVKSSSNYNWGKVTSYLWNIYDSYRDDPFIYNTFNLENRLDRNNDDINGYGSFVFDFIRNRHNEINYQNINNKFIDYYDPGDNYPDLQNSLNTYWNFLSGTSNKSHSAQIKNLDCQYNEQMLKLTFSWDSRSYIDGSFYTTYDNKDYHAEYTANHRNFEEGYKIYKSYNDGESWEIVTTIGNNQTTFDLLCGGEPNPCEDEVLFKVTSYNSSGESIDAPIIELNGQSGFNPTSIGNQEKMISPNLQLIPNPSDKILNIRYFLNQKCKIRLEIFDENLRLKDNFDNLSSEVGENNFKISLENYPSGNYFIKFISITDNGLINIKSDRFVVIK